MLRRSPDKSLTLFQIADDWSREIQPARSLDELLNELVAAWWRGELEATGGPMRLKLQFRSWLKDQEIADVVTFIRSSWGNRAAAATAQRVAEIRKATDASDDRAVVFRMK